MIRRPFYLKQLEQWIDKPLVKILTGIRRSGKSTILLLLKKVLLEKGISENSIIALNFESLTTEHLKNATSLYEYSGQTEPLNPGQTEPVIPGQSEPLIPVKLSHLRV